MFALVLCDCFVHLFKGGARAARAHPPFLLLAFLCGSFRQRKAAKGFWYQDLLDAFFFGIIATKKKALQKRNGVFSLKPLGSRF